MSGTVHEQDSDIVSVFEKHQETFGAGNVLGILAWKFKEIEEKNPFSVKLLYKVDGKVLMHFQKPPIIYVRSLSKTFSLESYSRTAIKNETKDLFSLEVQFDVAKNTSFGISFNFMALSGWWMLNEVNFEFNQEKVLLKNFDYSLSGLIGF